MRNPWGGFEWDGDWSDNSELWTEAMKDAFKPVLQSHDGSFWMSFKDFTSRFESMELCRVRNWDEIRIRGRFIRFSDTENTTNEVVMSKWFYALEVP